MRRKRGRKEGEEEGGEGGGRRRGEDRGRRRGEGTQDRRILTVFKVKSRQIEPFTRKCLAFKISYDFVSASKL